MTTAHAREQERLQRIIAALEKQLSEDAEVRRLQADRITELESTITERESDLADAVAIGTELSTALRWAMPDSPAVLRHDRRNGVCERFGRAATATDSEGL
jgi:type II secretory pathway component PulJ